MFLIFFVYFFLNYLFNLKGRFYWVPIYI